MRDGFASLGSGLLARKGGARPAMRPHGIGLDDLGWNDMTGGAPATSKREPIRFAAETLPEVLRQQEEIAREFAAAPAPIAAGKRKAFTLRLEPDRHQALRAICARHGLSAQHILTTALDRLLAGDATEAQEGERS